MANARLDAERREGTGKGVARKLRQRGRVPAVVYGRDLEPTHISIDAHQAGILFRAISVDNTIVEIGIAGENEVLETLVREIQSHPVRETLIHVDFLRVQKGVMVETLVPLHLTGVPTGVRLGGGVLEQSMHDLPIRCFPANIPQEITVDVSGLELNQGLHVSDLQLPEGVEITIPGDRSICSVAVPRVSGEGAKEGEGVAGEGAEGPAGS